MKNQNDALLTINGLADHFGLDRRTCKRYLASVPPEAIKNGRKLYSLRTMAAAIDEAKKRPMSPKATAEIALLEQRIIRLKRENSQAAKELVRVDEVGAMLRNIGNGQRAMLQNKLEIELPPQLAGLDPIQIRERMAAVVDQICGLYQGSIKQWVAPPPTPESELRENQRTETPSNPSPNPQAAGGDSTTEGTPGTASA